MSRAAETLGMPQGTASARLRKMLLFRQLKKHNENTCVRCGKEIEIVAELSVEHIKPWEGISADLFWDLDNVAFSHMKCNVPHTRRGGTPQRKIGPEGMIWCRVHKEFLPEDRFYKDPSRWNGLNGRCIDCHKSRPR
jgi:hypothetical protein